jgi:hypothetical protein
MYSLMSVIINKTEWRIHLQGYVTIVSGEHNVHSVLKMEAITP